ncbi:hypothetical protein BJF83_05305 [Nocardiopsis sp. CNR-923]|uniref:hypothetical protein n=1 Tax=Nocardiopsis sp. CNR-923 TaxID=1904965 RepID=UPI0009641F98|nr:hypothetical protein [Nocardiopsis sp. CNR-923]OLT25580.1 hypothetical protein BJF83_05305 [Nocardiopsis sp. CNR-923]
MREVVASALAELAGRDERAAVAAREALDTLAPDHDIERLTQYSVQRYCWFELPVRFQGSSDDRAFAARSLGSLLTLLHLHRYALVCSAPETVALSSAYDEDHDAGLAMYERLMWESGVEPPDLPELTWGGAVGDAEIRARLETAAALELAVAVGDVRPGEHGWRTAQARFTRSFLTQPDRRGLSHLDRVREERVRAWIGSPVHPHRQGLWPLVGRIIAGVDVPRAADTAMAPLRTLLDLAAEGIALTQIGYIAPGVVRLLCADFGWRTSPDPPRSETDATQLIALHQMLRGMRAVRRSGRRLVLTRRGRQLRQDPEALWLAAAETLCRTGGIEQAAAETLLGVLLTRSPQGTGAHTRRGVPDVVAAEHALTESGWVPAEVPMSAGRHAAAHRRTAETASDQVRALVMAVGWLLEALGLLTGDDGGGRRELTGPGRAFAITCLHTSAVAPRAVV